MPGEPRYMPYQRFAPAIVVRLAVEQEVTAFDRDEPGLFRRDRTGLLGGVAALHAAETIVTQTRLALTMRVKLRFFMGARV